MLARTADCLRMAPQSGKIVNSNSEVPFSARSPGSHPASYSDDPSFLGLVPPPQLLPLRNRPRLAPHMIPWLLEDDASTSGSSKSTPMATTHKVLAKLGAKLAAKDCIDAKEFYEAAEFYLRTRRRVRRPLMLDCCCGHGLAGLLFAAFEPSVLAVKLLDQRRPPSFDRVFAAVVEAAPWAESKVLFSSQLHALFCSMISFISVYQMIQFALVWCPSDLELSVACLHSNRWNITSVTFHIRHSSSPTTIPIVVPKAYQ
jgi:hypothetical protein